MSSSQQIARGTRRLRCLRPAIGFPRAAVFLQDRASLLSFQIDERVDAGANGHGTVRARGEACSLRPGRLRRIDFHSERLLLRDQNAVDIRELIDSGNAVASGIGESESLVLGRNSVA